ncbi:MAG: SAM-dependent chlorinase/fluorinase [Bacteroidia bacterium]|nr:SAM-dependent chlorinase/fluorinase [Bacteroidia bacterium]HMY14572.1 SAM-dependent chlorinase/fluorinase [Bacteroidia bacterium]HMY64845.1 SAM-dependent chlorinase/fluorinase [Bacteroidia bacterium]HNB34083.1 SAM-dependent chlorinase/fluorinase [Bacteroidia bacterium]HNI29118.1 SAM-dependent chlorinase/fluorinase [Bacteroidia bacterium]
MSLITLTTDWGLTDHYVAALKGELFSMLPGVNIVDISHQIPAYNFMKAAFVFKNAFYFFPPHTIHLICVDKQLNRTDDTHTGWMVVQYGESMIVCRNNGFFTLVSKQEPLKAVYIEGSEEVSVAHEKSFLVTLLHDLVHNKPLEELGQPVKSFYQSSMFQPSHDANSIQGTVIHIDIYGNAITNIEKEYFENVVGARRFEIDMPRYGETITKINYRYDDVTPGKMVALFNASGFLEIALNQGDISLLYGLEYADKIRILLQ